MDEQPSIKKRRIGTPGFWILLAVGAVIAVCVLAILVDSVVYYNKVHAGISVSGLDLGGQTKGQATASLTNLVDQSRNSPLTLKAGAKTWTVMPAQVGTTMDVQGAVKAALAFSRERNFLSDVITRFKLYFSGENLPLNGTVDSAKLNAVLGGIATQLDVAPVNAGLSIENGQIKVVEGVNGRAVDRATLAKQLTALLVSRRGTTVAIPIVTKEPAVQAQDNQAAQQQAETMIGAPITLASHGKTWTLTPEQIVSYMGFKSQDENGVSTLVPYIDDTKLAAFLDTVAPDVVVKAKDASFQNDGTKAWVVPGVNGEALDPVATAAAINAAALKTSDRTVEVAVQSSQPKLTTAAAQAMGIKDKLSSFTLSYVGSPNRQVNVRITARYASNVFMAPGDIYNADKQIGPRTAARGYKLAPGITGPNTLEDVLGGGICQVSTTLFNAVFFAGLNVVERHNHSIYINHYPKGRDATVTAGGKNMRFSNDTQHYIWIVGKSNGITTTFTIYGTNEHRKVTYTTSAFYNVRPMAKITVLDPSLPAGKSVVVQAGQSGRACTVVRTVTTPDGTVIHKNTFNSVWDMYPETVLVGPATTSTTKP